MPELLHEYRNGNYNVRIFSDGTKELFTEDDDFHAEFPDSIDLKITNACDLGCPMCHESSVPNGKHADLSPDTFLDALHPGTELAIGGGNPLFHPDLIPFLRRMKEQGVVANMTINERHLHSMRDKVDEILREKLIYGLGISLSVYADETFEFAKSYPHSVLHAIAGVADLDELLKRGDTALKLLVLGYKRHGRGEDFFDESIQNKITDFASALPMIFKKYGVVSFDNLALDQLDVKSKVPPQVFEESFMGADGGGNLYVDLVRREFSISSSSDDRYPMLPTAERMLDFIHYRYHSHSCCTPKS